MRPRDPFDNPVPSPAPPEWLPSPDAVAALARRHPGAVRRNVSLAPWTTLRIGGPAALLCRASNPAAVAEFLEFAAVHRLPVLVLGGGSNLLVDDRGFAGLVLQPDLREYAVAGTRVTAGAGLTLDELVQRTLADGLIGLEFASGIPGSVGGAVAGNAGCYGREIGDLVEAVTLMARDGTRRELSAEELGFGYRHSRLQATEGVILQVRLRLRRGDTTAALAERRERLADRRRKHPLRLPSAGSYFRNLPPAAPGEHRRAAGRLLDAVGARRMRCGDAGVYHKHANIVVNRGRARARDVLRLAAVMKAAVRERFGVELREEVRFVPWHGGYRTISG